jgi:hypothetical protein
LRDQPPSSDDRSRLSVLTGVGRIDRQPADSPHRKLHIEGLRRGWRLSPQRRLFAFSPIERLVGRVVSTRQQVRWSARAAPGADPSSSGLEIVDLDHAIGGLVGKPQRRGLGLCEDTLLDRIRDGIAVEPPLDHALLDRANEFGLDLGSARSP